LKINSLLCLFSVSSSRLLGCVVLDASYEAWLM
jgi:hypothetical protein